MQRIRPSGKWAVFLTFLEYDVDDVVSAMEILYMLDTADKDLARSSGRTVHHAESGGALPN